MLPRASLELVTERITDTVRVANPFRAMMMGIDRTIFFVKQVYVVIQRMVVDRSVGFESVSGPVGIVQVGSESLRRAPSSCCSSWAHLGQPCGGHFLPLPIFDGGVMVFLLIEKIKGGPVPIQDPGGDPNGRPGVDHNDLRLRAAAGSSNALSGERMSEDCSWERGWR